MLRRLDSITLDPPPGADRAPVALYLAQDSATQKGYWDVVPNGPPSAEPIELSERLAWREGVSQQGKRWGLFWCVLGKHQSRQAGKLQALWEGIARVTRVRSALRNKVDGGSALFLIIFEGDDDAGLHVVIPNGTGTERITTTKSNLVARGIVGASFGLEEFRIFTQQ